MEIIKENNVSKKNEYKNEYDLLFFNMNIDFKKYKRGSTLQKVGTVLKFFL